MTYKTVYNASDAALTVDEEGRVIGGREWGTVNTTDSVSKGHLDNGTLVVVEKPESDEGQNPDAVSAFARTAEIEDRADKVADLDKDSLRETAEKAGLLPEGSKVGVRALREQVAENTNVNVPSKSTTKKEA